jgi:hypothetical protein
MAMNVSEEHKNLANLALREVKEHLRQGERDVLRSEPVGDSLRAARVDLALGVDVRS